MLDYDMMEAAAPSPFCRSDFEQMTAQLRKRLRPTPALTLAEWLRVYLGLSNAKDEPRGDFPPRDEIAQLPCLGPSDLKRQLSSVLRAILSCDSPQGAVAAHIPNLPERTGSHA